MKTLRILLADDHKVLRDGLSLLIQQQPDLKIVGEAANGKEAVHLALTLRPDVVVMDLSMPEMNGLQATEAIKAQNPRVQVLVLTIHEDASYLRQLCRAKAAGYVLKRSAGEELIRAIRQVAAGENHFDARLAGQVLARRNWGASTNGDLASEDLSGRELEILRGVAWGYSNKEIAAQLDLSVKTVETYKVRVSKKLGLYSRTAMLRYALRQGWLNDAPTPALAC